MKRFTSRKVGGATVRRWHDRTVKGQFALAFAPSAVAPRDDVQSVDDFMRRGEARPFQVALDWSQDKLEETFEIIARRRALEIMGA